MSNSTAYWTQWQVPLCALILLLPLIGSLIVLSKSDPDPIRSVQLWRPCWKKVHPIWLLAYRFLVLLPMAYLWCEMAMYRGVSAFYFYTQWTFTLVIIYFLIATLVSAQGCWTYSKAHVSEKEEVKRLLERDFEESPAAETLVTIETSDEVQLQNYHKKREMEQTAGFWGHTMQIAYQTSAGAVILTDVVFWGLLVPFSSSEYFRLDVIKGCVHSLNAVFLLLDTSLNSLPFPAFRMAYFVLWSCIYVIFQWVLHACGSQWWAYPFLELATPWSPLWYLCMALVHIPCYGMYSLIVKAKKSVVANFTTNVTM